MSSSLSIRENINPIKEKEVLEHYVKDYPSSSGDSGLVEERPEAGQDSTSLHSAGFRKSAFHQFHQLAFANIMGQGRVNQLGGVFINGRPLPLHIRQKIVEMAKDGIKPCQISRELRVSHGCVSKILYRYAETGSIEPGQHQINKNGLKKSHKTPLQVKQSILAVSKAFPDLKPFQIREILISRNLVPKTSIPTLNQISEILGTPKIKHSVKDILKDHEEDSYNILEESAGDQRRVRTSFSTDQLTILERAFLMNNYPDAFQREQIGLQTGLCDSRIQVWFSNRRARSRKHMVFSGMNLNNSLNLGLQKSENLNFQNSEKFSLQIPQNLGLQKSENLDLQKSQIQLPVNLPSVFPGIGTSLNHVLYPQAFTNILFQIQLNSMKNSPLNLLNPTSSIF